MARITGRMVIVGSMGVAAMALLTGWVLDRHLAATRWMYVVAGLCGLLAALRYRAVRVRREYRLLALESGEGRATHAFSLGMLREILRGDPSFRRYMFWMSLYGSGNLMMNAQLVVLFSDRLHLAGLTQILLLTVVPLALVPLFLPWWARMFDRGNIIDYRSRQCWVLVVAIVLMSLGVALNGAGLLWVGAVLVGVSVAGANLGWNLGHNDFAGPGRAQHYMGVNVTLSGVRGLFAPPVGMAAYEGLEILRPGLGIAAMLLPVGLVAAGAMGFVHMRNDPARIAARARINRGMT
jgi:uncharacterized membrane protein YuzA (DUF378 family)